MPRAAGLGETMKTTEEVKAFLARLEVEFDGHTESLDWENEQLGNIDALRDILDPDRTPYTFLDLRESIIKYMGYLRAMEWFHGDGPHPPAWKFWEDPLPRFWRPRYVTWECPECHTRNVTEHGETDYTMRQDQGQENWPDSDGACRVTRLTCDECDNMALAEDDNLATWVVGGPFQPKR